MISMMISHLLEKLKGFGEESMILMNSTQAKLKAVGADKMVNNLQEKIKQLYFLLEKMKGIGEGSMIMMNSTQAKLKAAGADEMMSNLREKLKQLPLMLQIFGLLRNERLQHWLRVGAPFVVAGLVCLVLFWCFSRCIGYYFRFIGRCIRRCCRGTVKMMKAPGTSFWIPRAVFEADPKGYFIALRAGKVKF